MNVAVGLCISVFAVVVLAVFRKPVFFILKSLANGVFGIMLILAANEFLPGISAGINPYTAVVSVIFGIPGAALICILDKIL